MRRQIARWMRRTADVVDHEGSPKFTGWSFTIERGEGIRFREDGQGCRLFYLGDDEREKAHAQADSQLPQGMSVREREATA